MKKLAIACASTLLACAGVELAHRLVSSLRGEPYAAARAAEELTRKADFSGAFVPGGAFPDDEQGEDSSGLLHPYYGSEREHDTGGVLEAFRLGFGASDYTVVVVGGSVAVQWAERADTFVAALAADERLRGRQVRVLDFAHAAYKQPQQLMRVAYLFSLGHVPDAIINLDGFNELMGVLQNSNWHIHPAYPTPPIWAAPVQRLASFDDRELEILGRMWAIRESVRAAVDRALGLGLQRSSILGSFWLRRVDRLNGEFGRLQAELVAGPAEGQSGIDRQLRGGDFDRDQQALVDLAARVWFEGSLSIDALCRARGVEYLHVLQPALTDEGSKPPSREERRLRLGPAEWKNGPRLGYDGLRELGRELAGRGVRFLDASGVFEGTRATVYTDACHLNDAGNEILGAAISRAFLEGL